MDQDPRLCDVGVYQKRVKVWVRLRLKRVGVKVAAVRDPRWLISAERVRLWKREKKGCLMFALGYSLRRRASILTAGRS